MVYIAREYGRHFTEKLVARTVNLLQGWHQVGAGGGGQGVAPRRKASPPLGKAGRL